MPNLVVDLPVVGTEAKARLATALAGAFAEASGFSPAQVDVLVREHAPEDAPLRPYLCLTIHTPKLRRSTKRRVVGALTAAFGEALGQPGWQPVTYISEHETESIGLEGALLCDHVAASPWKYALPDE